MEPTTLVFLDIETTGLDPDLHEVWEVAYALEQGDPLSFVVPHTLRTADPKALELNGYHRRVVRPGEGLFGSNVQETADLHLRQALGGVTIVGANPAFDTAFLRRRWGVAPWHYRLLDVEAMAVGVLGLDRPKGLNALAEALALDGFVIPSPDHTAAGDVLTTRAVYNALRRIA